jgi:carbamoyltransferase
MMYILGISAYYHDSAAALICDGRIVAAAQEERFSRIKHDLSFPRRAVRYCLDEAGILPDAVSSVVFYDKPLLKFERIIETVLRFAPFGFASFRLGLPEWIKEKLFFKSMLKRQLSALGITDFKKTPLLFSEHHLSHAASAFFPSPYADAAILTVDGVGEWATMSLCEGKDNTIKLRQELHFPDSAGLLYAAFTWFLGFKVNSDEYKLMGLAAYGSAEDTETCGYIDIIRRHIVHVFADGSIRLNMRYFNFHLGTTMIKLPLWERLFGMKRREPGSAIARSHQQLAFAIQWVTEDIVFRLAAEAKRLTGAADLCMAGGVALNCVANGKLLRSGLFRHIYVQPAAGDAGGALGAALAAYYIYGGHPRQVQENNMQGCMLGPSFSANEVRAMAARRQAVMEELPGEDAVCRTTAELIAQGKVVGWFQGRMEFGPRALGNRSILADARNKDMQQLLNAKIKHRESFRPFAPAVLAERAQAYFEPAIHSDYMLFTVDVKDTTHFPAITHVDLSARVQTVDRDVHAKFYNLIKHFEALTACPMLINTSLNTRGEPVVCTPDDAFSCFMTTDMDYLVIENFIFDKTKQPIVDI